MLKYGYDQSSKRMALGIWIAVSTMLLGAMLTMIPPPAICGSVE
jgi:hypothetical protein